jgi:UDP-glucose 4-epimerase
MKRILITGGAGFIGFHLAKFYAKKNFKVDIIDNLSRGKIDDDFKNLLKKKNVTFFKKNLEKKINLNFNYDFVFHCAAIIGVKHVIKKPYEVLTKNIKLLENIISFCRTQKKLKRLIFFSSSEVYAETADNKLLKYPTPENSLILINNTFKKRSTYMLSKFYGEYMCFMSGIKCTIIRPHNFYGPRMGLSHVIPELAKKIQTRLSVKVHSYFHKRTFHYIDDAILQIFNLLNKKNSINKIFNIGSHSELTIFNLAKKIKSILKRTKTTLVKKKDIHNSPQRRLPDLSLLNSICIKNDNFSIENGLKETINWYKKKKYFKNLNKKIIL